MARTIVINSTALDLEPPSDIETIISLRFNRIWVDLGVSPYQIIKGFAKSETPVASVNDPEGSTEIIVTFRVFAENDEYKWVKNPGENWAPPSNKKINIKMNNVSSLGLGVGVDHATYLILLDCCKNNSIDFIKLDIVLNLWKQRGAGRDSRVFFPPESNDLAFGYIYDFEWRIKPNYLQTQKIMDWWTDKIAPTPNVSVLDEAVLCKLESIRKILFGLQVFVGVAVALLIIIALRL